ncbi:unnamed protein product [Linum trigynum]|uniref:Uncharacterized protein n=1 Tax=Linum trigynum TaxID=586398 RepID=A0AAV2CS98_9ROSI
MVAGLSLDDNLKYLLILKLLESVSPCREGMAELCGDSVCVEAVDGGRGDEVDGVLPVEDQKAVVAMVRSNGDMSMMRNPFPPFDLGFLLVE